MINVELLSADEKAWLNDYHEQVRKVVGQAMAMQDRCAAIEVTLWQLYFNFGQAF